jgi:hypothetical protein
VLEVGVVDGGVVRARRRRKLDVADLAHHHLAQPLSANLLGGRPASSQARARRSRAGGGEAPPPPTPKKKKKKKKKKQKKKKKKKKKKKTAIPRFEFRIGPSHIAACMDAPRIDFPWRRGLNDRLDRPGGIDAALADLAQRRHELVEARRLDGAIQI